MGETRKYLVLALLADLPEPDVIPPDVPEVKGNTKADPLGRSP
jgi:hypothetical protein